ncbi:MAG: recombination mediator RecR [Deltaproteobacteria bacterium]|jgi:recombination protein RecR|nr:recombination mediator RecR [Deltaproteobacteria bacterium]
MTNAHAEPIFRLIQELTKLPGIGAKTASRLAMHILRSSREDTEGLARAIVEVKEKIHLCSVCFNLTDQDPCHSCQDMKRNQEGICVVSGPEDLMAIERSGSYRGLYHVLHGVLSPLEGIGPKDLKIRELLNRLQDGKVKEVILAMNPSMEGEATAQYLSQIIKPLGVRVTRIARGIPMGGELQYSDDVTLSKSLENRSPL